MFLFSSHLSTWLLRYRSRPPRIRLGDPFQLVSVLCPFGLAEPPRHSALVLLRLLGPPRPATSLPSAWRAPRTAGALQAPLSFASPIQSRARQCRLQSPLSGCFPSGLALMHLIAPAHSPPSMRSVKSGLVPLGRLLRFATFQDKPSSVVPVRPSAAQVLPRSIALSRAPSFQLLPLLARLTRGPSSHHPVRHLHALPPMPLSPRQPQPTRVTSCSAAFFQVGPRAPTQAAFTSLSAILRESGFQPRSRPTRAISPKVTSSLDSTRQPSLPGRSPPAALALSLNSCLPPTVSLVFGPAWSCRHDPGLFISALVGSRPMQPRPPRDSTRLALSRRDTPSPVGPSHDICACPPRTVQLEPRLVSMPPLLLLKPLRVSFGLCCSCQAHVGQPPGSARLFTTPPSTCQV